MSNSCGLNTVAKSLKATGHHCFIFIQFQENRHKKVLSFWPHSTLAMQQIPSISAKTCQNVESLARALFLFRTRPHNLTHFVHSIVSVDFEMLTISPKLLTFLARCAHFYHLFFSLFLTFLRIWISV